MLRLDNEPGKGHAAKTMALIKRYGEATKYGKGSVGCRDPELETKFNELRERSGIGTFLSTSIAPRRSRPWGNKKKHLKPTAE